MELTLLCRDAANGQALRERLMRHGRGAAVEVAVVDLARHQEITRWAAGIEAADLLVNNAATAPRVRQETPEGIEVQLATNVLSYLWLAEALRPALQRGAKARIVNVASYWAGDLDLADLQFVRRRYDNNAAYRQSKQANRMLTYAQSRRYRPLHLAVNCCHPGDVNSVLSKSLGFGGSQSAAEGAATPLALALTDLGWTNSGMYFADSRPARCEFSADVAAQEALFTACSEFSTPP